MFYYFVSKLGEDFTKELFVVQEKKAAFCAGFKITYEVNKLARNYS